MKIRKLFLLLLIFLFAYPVLSYDTVISNSNKWQDVYSTMLYASLTGAKGYFLVSSRHSTLLLNQLGTLSDIQIINSKKNPFVVGYRQVMESKGFSKVADFNSDNINLDLARDLDVTDFIVIDDSYGYNAISIAPYAALSKSYVLFVNRKNLNSIYAFLKGRTVSSLILYGQLDREVKERLDEFNPEIIFNGDRFADNLAILDKYQEVHTELKGSPKSQAILSNGEFIEQEIMTGVEPIVFIGRGNVPDLVRQYIENSDIDIGILIGNELIGSATYVRRQLGISVFVKFAQSARNPAGPIAQVEDLDRFYLPRYILNIDVYRIRYNVLTNRVEITYQNKEDLATYLKGTITLTTEEGDSQIVGEVDPIFIDKSEYKTVLYDEQSDGERLQAMQGNLTAEVFAIFGESKGSLEYTLRKTMSVEVVEILDNSNIQIKNILYDNRKGKFLIEIENTGEVDVFVDLEILDMLINDELVTVGTDGVVFIEKGKKVTVEIAVEMDEEDIKNNPKVHIRAYFGERERSLVNVLEGEYEYSMTGIGYMTGQLIRDFASQSAVIAPMVVIIILLALILGMKKKCPYCKEINNLRAKKCKRCGNDI